MTARLRWAIAIVTAVLLLGGALAYGATAYIRFQERQSSAPAVRVAESGAPVAAGRVVFRNTTLGAGYGMVASVPLSDVGGPRAVSDRACDRVFADASHELCLRSDRGLLTSYRAVLSDADGTELSEWPVPGIPSRARLSEYGPLAATTVFVSGHSYAPASFSTVTRIESTDPAVAAPGDLEEFAFSVAGEPVTAVDRNFWGVTFAGDGDTFYATAASGPRTWLVRGSIAARTLVAIHDTAECPSLSPDGTRVAYKKNVATGGTPDWRIAVLDLASNTEVVLAEERSVDDQVVWFDDVTLLYALPRTDQAGDTDVWSIAAEPATPPRVFLEHAWSPSVVRAAP